MAAAKEVEFDKTFEAPLDRVWQAWTDPELIKKWWGPDNVSIPECEVDLRVGGQFYIVMEAGEAMGDYAGTRWPMKGTFTEINEKTKLAYSAKAWTEGSEVASSIDTDSVLSFSEDDGKTKMNLKVTVNKVGPAAGMAIQGMQAGFNQQFEKLAKFLSN